MARLADGPVIAGHPPSPAQRAGAPSSRPGPAERLPLVSVGVPVYNGAPYVRLALDALLDQDYPSFEVVISDNASSDDTPAICLEYAARDSRVRYHRNEVDAGAGPNFLKVLSLAKGEYFMWAAHDDLWEPDFISTLMCCFRSVPALIFAMSHYDRFSHVTEERGTVPPEGYPAINKSNSIFENCCIYLRKGSSELIYGIFRTSVLRDTRFSRLSMFDWGDVFLINEICTRGAMHLVPKVLFHTGFVAPRPIKSFARSRLPGFKWSYSSYYVQSAWCFSRASTLRLWQKAHLLWLLTMQLASMVYTYELPPAPKRGLERLRAALRR